MTIDDDILTAALHDYADTIDIPNRGAEDILRRAAGATGAPSAPRRPRGAVLLATAAGLVILAGVGLAITNAGDKSSFDSVVTKAALNGSASETSTGANGFGAPSSTAPSPSPAFNRVSGSTTTIAPASDPADGFGDDARRTTSDRVYVADAGTKLIRTGSVDLQVKKGRLTTALDRVGAIADGAGGFVAGSRTREAAEPPTGSMRLRVPSAQFDSTIAALRDVGTVKALDTQGEDVSGEYTDNASRLRALRATRDQFYTVLSKATAIGDILAVQDRINNVQSQIEEIEGRQQYLDNQTSYSTLAVTIAEPAPKVAERIAPEEPSGIGAAWDEAKAGFTNRIERIVAHSGSWSITLLALFLALACIKLAWPYLRRAIL